MKYIGIYDTLRPFLRYIAYGCYHKSYLMQKLGQSARIYEDNLARLRFFLPADKIQTTRHGHKEIHTLKGDIYQHNDHYLAKTYQTKALKPKAAFYFLSLLQIFADADEPLDETTLLQQKLTPTDWPRPSGIKDISRSTMNRYLNELVQLGLVERIPGKGRYYYQKSSRTFSGLSCNETSQLQSIVNFYAHIVPLVLPGIFLKNYLEDLNQPDKHNNLIQVKHYSIDKIIDEELLHLLNYCIEQKLTVIFTYRSREISAVPLKLLIDCYEQRQYLEALGKNTPTAQHYSILQKFRIDLITNLRPGPPAPDCQNPPTPVLHKLSLQLKTTSDHETENIKYRILQRFPQAELSVSDIDEHILLCTLSIHDDLKLLPWLRTFYPFLCPHTISSPLLRQRLIADLKEALTNYGIYPPVS